MSTETFRISGRIIEEETGRPAPGLLVRGYDKDLLFDDLLGTATTDAEGAFELLYYEKDFRELFDRRPDIYLAIYCSPDRFLLDTRESVRWGTGSDEAFEITLPRKELGDCSPTRPSNQVQSGLGLLGKRLTFKKRGVYDVPSLPGFVTTGRPGAPAVPHQMRYIALPYGTEVLSFEYDPGEPVVLEGPFNAFPAQLPVADRGSEIDSAVPMTPPDPHWYEGTHRFPDLLAELVQVEDIGPLRLAAVQVRPVQFAPGTQSYIFYPDLTFTLTFDENQAQQAAQARIEAGAILGEIESEFYTDLLQNELPARPACTGHPYNWKIPPI